MSIAKTPIYDIISKQTDVLDSYLAFVRQDHGVDDIATWIFLPHRAEAEVAAARERLAFLFVMNLLEDLFRQDCYLADPGPVEFVDDWVNRILLFARQYDLLHK